MTTVNSGLVYFNGVNASTGEYLIPPLSTEQLSQMAKGESFEPAQLAEMKWRSAQNEAHYAVKEGIDPKDIAQAGWGVIFPEATNPAIKDALGELFAHRQKQANRIQERYREFSGPRGYRPSDTKNSFLSRLGIGPGPVDPDIVPYYLLIVGSPDVIPFSFQAQLDVAYAVGRIYFDTLDEYAQYAHSVVQAEQQALTLPRTATFFGVQNTDDATTHLSATHLIAPLARKVQSDQPGWAVQTLAGEDATKARLAHLLGGDETPALLFTASHGVGFDPDDRRQYQHQGALVCQDWPGPVAGQGRAFTPDWYFAGDDVSSDARLYGLIAFHFACFGAGTPKYDEFAHAKQGMRARSQIAQSALVAGLPKRMLAHPKGGALAVIGHVERAWGSSFMWDQAGAQLAVFQSTLKRLMEGHPIGSALEFFNQRYAELSTALSNELEEVHYGKRVDPLTLAGLWTAHNDARGYAVIGDPAVRLMVGESAPAQRPVVETIHLTQSIPQAMPNAAAPAHTNGQPPADAMHESVVENQPGEYGLFDATALQQAQGRLMVSLQQFTERLGSTLAQVINEASSVEIKTYVSDDLGDVGYERGTFTGNVTLRAITRIGIAGDTQVCVPQTDENTIDEKLWAVHLSMVQQAQTHRAEFIKTVVSAATGLLGTLKGG